MNPDALFWCGLLGRLALAGGVVVMVTAVVARRGDDAVRARTAWRACWAGLLLAAVLELMGGVRGVLRPSIATDPLRPPLGWTVSRIDPTPDGTDLLRFSDAATRANPARPVLRVGLAWWPAAVWATGLAGLLLRLFFAHGILLRHRRRMTRLEEDEIPHRWAGVARAFGVRGVALYESPVAAVPFTFGVFAPAICLPSNFCDEFSSAAQEAVLAHELAHAAGRDPAWLLVGEVATAVWWWHPAVWWARSASAAAAERVADEASRVVDGGPLALAECLLSMARRLTGTRSLQWVGMAGGGPRSALAVRAQRLLAMSSARVAGPVPRLRPALAATVCAAVLAAVVTGSAVPIGVAEPPATRQEAFQRSLAGRALALLPRSADGGAGGAAQVSLPAERIRSVVLDEVILEGSTVQEALDLIRAQMVRADPAMGSITVGIPEASGRSREARRQVVTRIPPFRRARLGFILDELMASLGPGWTYEIGARGIVVQSDVEAAGLLTRTFMVDSNAMGRLARSMPPAERESRGGGRGEAPGGSAGTTEVDGFRALRVILEKKGIDLKPPRQVFYKPRFGLLMIRATQDEFRRIEAVLSEASLEAQRIRISGRFLSISGARVENDAVRHAVGLDRGSPDANDGRSLVSDRACIPMSPIPAAATGYASSKALVLPPDRARAVMQDLESRQGGALLASPRIETVVGVPGRLETTLSDPVAAPTAVPPTNVLMGVTLEAMVQVTPEGLFLLSFTSSFGERFAMEPHPLYQVREAHAEVVLQDRHTAIIALPVAPRTDSNPVEAPVRDVLVMLTPEFVDPQPRR